MGVFIVGFVTAIGAIGSIVGIIILIINLRKNNESDEKKWHYLDISRGRYLCLEHGGFCYKSDGHAKTCPICNDTEKLQINKISRSLQIIRGLQARSLNRFSILSGIIGVLGLFSFFQSPELLIHLRLDDFEKSLFYFSGVFFLASFFFYLISMKHVKTTQWFNPVKFQIKTITQWERYMAFNLSLFEVFHKLGNLFLCSSILLLILFSITQLFSS